MKTIYSVHLRFETVPPLYTERTMFVATALAVEEVKSNAERGGYEVLGFSVQHVMSPTEVIKDIANEIMASKLAAGY